MRTWAQSCRSPGRNNELVLRMCSRFAWQLSASIRRQSSDSKGRSIVGSGPFVLAVTSVEAQLNMCRSTSALFGIEAPRPCHCPSRGDVEEHEAVKNREVAAVQDWIDRDLAGRTKAVAKKISKRQEPRAGERCGPSEKAQYQQDSADGKEGALPRGDGEIEQTRHRKPSGEYRAQIRNC